VQGLQKLFGKGVDPHRIENNVSAEISQTMLLQIIEHRRISVVGKDGD
jgi:broad-specificity NMP kinase